MDTYFVTFHFCIGVTTYDLKIVLDFLASLHLQTLSLRDLSMKLVLLLLLLSGQRLQTVQAFNVNDIQLNDDSCTFYIRKLLKTSKPRAFYRGKQKCVAKRLLSAFEVYYVNGIIPSRKKSSRI